MKRVTVMLRLVMLLALAVPLLSSADSACAAVTSQSVERNVEAVAGANVNEDTPPDAFDDFASMDLGPFLHEAFAGVNADAGADSAESVATVLQYSIVQKKSVEAFGLTDSSALVTTMSGGGAHADSATQLVYDFSLDAPADYDVLGQVDAFGPVSDASLVLTMNGSVQIFAIGEPVGYAPTEIAQSGTLAPGNYRLFAEADTILSQIGPTGSGIGTAGAEFEFIFALDVVAPGEVVNGGFDALDPMTGSIFQWTDSGAAEAIQTGGGVHVDLQTGATLSQNIDALPSPFFVEFDYRFASTEGTLAVLLNGMTIGQLTAPPTVDPSLQHAEVLVDNPLLGGLIGVPLTFSFAAPTAGQHFELDNVSLSPALAADFDRDGSVDGADLAIWGRDFGLAAGATQIQGDANADAAVDGRDFLIWQRHYGSPLPAAANVPEPNPAVLAAIAALAVRRRRRR